MVLSLAACDAPAAPDDLPEPVAASPPTPSPSPAAAASIESCLDLSVPDGREVNTNLDRESGLLVFSYYVPKLGRDRHVTIRYRDDPWCRRNRETLDLIKHAGAGKEVLGCLELPEVPPAGMTRVELWFFDRFDPGGLAPTLLVRRDIPTTGAIAAASVEAWIGGPTKAEREVGARPSAPEGTELLGIDIDDATATVDLNREFELTGLGTTYEGAVLTHVAGILTQFDAIDKALLKIEGEFKDYYMGHGFIVDERHPLVRPPRKHYRVAGTC